MGDHMNNYDFVELINSKTRDEVVRIVEQDLDNPSVSRSTILNELSDWYNTKDDSGRQLVTKLIKRVYDCAAWRILHLLDSGRDHGGRFELCFIDDETGEKIQFIDPPDLEELHELYEPEFRGQIIYPKTK